VSGCESALRKFAGRLFERFEVDDRLVVAEQLISSGVSASSVPSLLGFDRRTFVPAFRRRIGHRPEALRNSDARRGRFGMSDLSEVRERRSRRLSVF